MINKLIIGIALLLTLTGCGATEELEEKEEAPKYPEGYEIVSYTNLYQETDIRFTELRHIKTGCHYTSTDAYESETIEQMFVEKDGVSVPYCD